MPLTPEEQRARQREYQRRYRERHPDVARASYLKNRDRILARNKRRYQSDPDRFNRIINENRTRRYEAEAGRPKPDYCEVCGRSGQRINFDHCHQRGVFRGWLCFNCNAVLGHVNDDPDRLRKLIAYLERTKDLIAPQLELPV